MNWRPGDIVPLEGDAGDRPCRRDTCLSPGCGDGCGFAGAVTPRHPVLWTGTHWDAFERGEVSGTGRVSRTPDGQWDVDTDAAAYTAAMARDRVSLMKDPGHIARHRDRIAGQIAAWDTRPYDRADG